ncbi:aryl-alcohol dehydrogenase-like predicted oxidoreductase [Arthrobacter sp. V1I7]|uniref:aldo/keto reductase n=1 Tax=Arthrobacter sp. V1I7 TaxID=3042274 RepID=UPI00278168C2|nr:aldo/keto reductase [Arthrobacter sp. V1I7]MDQ0821550.1 aryl-alcohol dehydrogenase-like predicted oxidoreductase [Arthrobacter sp. V1I7]
MSVDGFGVMKNLAQSHGISIKAASLQFSLAHPAIAAVIPGATKPSRIAEDVAALGEQVPAGLLVSSS